MLTYESLIDRARLRGMPAAKMRGILREYLQILILKELYRTKSGKKLYFTGGTYLRLLHNLKRFSEDLDFNTNAIKSEEFEELLGLVKDGLRLAGIESELEFSHWGTVYVSRIVFPEIEKAYNAVSRYSKKRGIVIKVETNKLRWRVATETNVVSGFGEIYPVICTGGGVLFADKIDALNKKERGRHIYDIMFMLSGQWPIDMQHLRKLRIKENPLDVITSRIMSFSKTELKRQAEALRPFLFDESEADLVINAHDIIPALIKKYR